MNAYTLCVCVYVSVFVCVCVCMCVCLCMYWCVCMCVLSHRCRWFHSVATRLVPGGSTSPESWKLSKRVDLGRDQLNQLNHPRENDTLGDYSDLVYKKNSGKFYRE